MKFPRLIALSLVGLMSAGATLAIAEYNNPAVDRTFPIEDIAGDPKHINNIEFENIIKTDHNSFERVIFSKDEVEFEKTIYDVNKGADEQILANKEVYRGTVSPAELENDEYIITAEFNVQYPYISKEPYVKIAIKDKESETVINKQVPLQGFTSNENVWKQILMEWEGRFYYAFFSANGGNDESVLYMYELDPETAALKKEIDSVSDISNSTNLTYDDGKLYTILYDEPGNEHLLTIDLANKTSETKKLTFGNNPNEGIESITAQDGQLYVQMSGNTHIINSKTLETIAIAQPYIKEKLDYLYAEEIKSDNGLLYIIYETFKNEMNAEYIGVYESKTGKMLYEGKLPSMDNRGVNRTHTFAH